jgi:hypothetical protein
MGLPITPESRWETPLLSSSHYRAVSGGGRIDAINHGIVLSVGVRVPSPGTVTICTTTVIDASNSER